MTTLPAPLMLLDDFVDLLLKEPKRQRDKWIRAFAKAWLLRLVCGRGVTIHAIPTTVVVGRGVRGGTGRALSRATAKSNRRRAARRDK